MSGNNKTTLIVIALASVGTVLGAYAYDKGVLPNVGSFFGSGIAPGQMPSCDSQTTISLATRAFHNSPRIKQLGVTIQRMNMLGQQYENKDDAGTVIERSCLAEIYTNAGQTYLGFKMTWMNPTKTELWLEIPNLPF